ncbi:alpha/beta fold hydrolase [Paracoccus sp. (in: a-proteobacteria)]|uniref:alpha/beta fold hydrolase n=1 Tax=Paracoccus sp. TaxID=267 RepID=UPI003A84E82F
MRFRTLMLCERELTVSGREAGQGDPVVLLHGVGTQSAMWRPQIEALSRSHHALALDLPGHGGSSPLPPDSGLAEFVHWLHRALAGLGLNRVSLVGHSLGALIAAGFGASHPGMVSRIALLNGVHCRDAPMRASVLARAAAIRSNAQNTVSSLKRWFGDSDADHAARVHVASWLGAMDPAGYATAYAAFANGDAIYADRLATISCPLLALTGGDDQNSTPAMSEAMAEAAPLGRAVILPGHRHMVNMTAADQVNKELRLWLATTDRLQKAS